MSEETYVIAKDGEGEEIEVQRVICTKCEHYEYMTPEKASKVDDSFICNLCSTSDGVFRGVRQFEQCSECSEVYDVKNPVCFCPNEPKPLLTWYDKSKNPTADRARDQIEESKMQGLERKLVRNSRLEALDREKRMDENLQKLVEILLKKEKKDALSK